MKLVFCMYQLCTVIIRRLSPLQTQKIMRWEGHVAYMWDRKWDGEACTGLSGSGRDRWQAIANAVMNLHVPENVENFLTS
jgi:hypothetical protein